MSPIDKTVVLLLFMWPLILFCYAMYKLNSLGADVFGGLAQMASKHQKLVDIINILTSKKIKGQRYAAKE